jgi:hypothetical protein
MKIIIRILILIFTFLIYSKSVYCQENCTIEFKRISLLQCSIDSLVKNNWFSFPKKYEPEKLYIILASPPFMEQIITVNDSVRFKFYSYEECVSKNIKDYIEILDFNIDADSGKILLFNRKSGHYMKSEYKNVNCKWINGTVNNYIF